MSLVTVSWRRSGSFVRSGHTPGESSSFEREDGLSPSSLDTGKGDQDFSFRSLLGRKCWQPSWQMEKWGHPRNSADDCVGQGTLNH